MRIIFCNYKRYDFHAWTGGFKLPGSVEMIKRRFGLAPPTFNTIKSMNIGQKYLWQRGRRENAVWFTAPLMKFHNWFRSQLAARRFIATQARFSNRSTVRLILRVSHCQLHRKLLMRVARNREIRYPCYSASPYVIDLRTFLAALHERCLPWFINTLYRCYN